MIEEGEEGAEYLLFDVSTEDDTLTAVVGWGSDMARRVAERFALLEKLASENPGLEDLVYGAGAGVELFEYNDLEGTLSESCLNHYQELNWASLASKPELINPLRLSSAEFRINKWGSFYWVMMEKHGTHPSETQGLTIKYNPRLFRY